jgi:hypothetical protein
MSKAILFFTLMSAFFAGASWGRVDCFDLSFRITLTLWNRLKKKSRPNPYRASRGFAVEGEGGEVSHFGS